MSNTPQDPSASNPPKMNPGDQGEPGTPGVGENICPECKGSGKLGANACPTCGGTGKIMEGIGGG